MTKQDILNLIAGYDFFGGFITPDGINPNNVIGVIDGKNVTADVAQNPPKFRQIYTVYFDDVDIINNASRAETRCEIYVVDDGLDTENASFHGLPPVSKWNAIIAQSATQQAAVQTQLDTLKTNTVNKIA